MLAELAGAIVIAFGAIAPSFVFAFGLGGRRAGGQIWEDHMQQRKQQRDKAAEPFIEK